MLTERDHAIAGAIINALFDSQLPLSTVEVWHGARVYDDSCTYHAVKRILRSGEIEGVAMKEQMGGYGRRDYYLKSEFREAMILDGFAV